jgi:hypothetical protein
LVNIISPESCNGNEDKQRGKTSGNKCLNNFAILELLMDFKQIEKLVSLKMRLKRVNYLRFNDLVLILIFFGYLLVIT